MSLLSATTYESRIGHVAVAHKGRIVLWGGYLAKNDILTICPPARVLVHQDLRWSAQETSGEIPPPTCGAAAQAAKGMIFVVGGEVEGKAVNDVYSLDLTSWTWRKMEPAGVKPCKFHDGSSWLHGGRIYLFGGYGPDWEEEGRQLMPREVEFSPHGDLDGGMNNQLVAYDVKDDAWVWPTCSGEVPSPRASHAACVAGSKAVVFGGEGGSLTKRCSREMFCLDMDTFLWEMVSSKEEPDDDDHPCGRAFHTLTPIDDRRVLLYGGRDGYHSMLGDCWTMDVGMTRRRWERCRHLEVGPMSEHQAVREGLTGQVWMLGGYGEGSFEVAASSYYKPAEILRLTAQPLSLFVLALKSVARKRQRLSSEFRRLPTTLQKLIASI